MNYEKKTTQLYSHTNYTVKIVEDKEYVHFVIMFFFFLFPEYIIGERISGLNRLH